MKYSRSRRRLQIPVEIWHLKTAYKKNWGRMPHVLDADQAGARSRTRRNRRHLSLHRRQYVAERVFAAVGAGRRDGKDARRLRDPQTRQRLKKEISEEQTEWENIYLGSGGPSGVLIGSVVNRELDSLQGKRISEIAAQQKKDPLDTLFDLILADHGQTGAIYFMMSEADMRAAMQSPFVSFCTDSGSRATDGPLAGSKSHPRGWGSYPRILGRYVRDEKLLSLETAIHKMTARPQRVSACAIAV